MSASMLAVVVEEPTKVAVKRVPVPELLPGRVLVRVHHGTICGSDPMVVDGTYPAVRYPVVLGHELSGEVADVGDGVSSVSVGDRVTLESHLGCGKCTNCIQGMYTVCLNYGRMETGHQQLGFTVDGGFAEYVLAPEFAVHRLPDNVDLADAPITQILAVALHGLRVIGGVLPRETVVVVGPGSLGLLAVQAVRRPVSARTILVGTREDRLALGERRGADVAVRADLVDPVQAVLDVTGGVGADLVIETAGTALAAEQAVEMVRPGGRILLLGVSKTAATIRTAKIVLGGIRVAGARAEGMWSMKDAIALMAAGAINFDGLITHRFAIADFPAALSHAIHRTDNALKVGIEIS